MHGCNYSQCTLRSEMFPLVKFALFRLPNGQKSHKFLALGLYNISFFKRKKIKTGKLYQAIIVKIRQEYMRNYRHTIVKTGYFSPNPCSHLRN